MTTHIIDVISDSTYWWTTDDNQDYPRDELVIIHHCSIHLLAYFSANVVPGNEKFEVLPTFSNHKQINIHIIKSSTPMNHYRINITKTEFKNIFFHVYKSKIKVVPTKDKLTNI